MVESLQRLTLDKKYKQEKELNNSKNMSTDRIPNYKNLISNKLWIDQHYVMTRSDINYEEISNKWLD